MRYVWCLGTSWHVLTGCNPGSTLQEQHKTIVVSVFFVELVCFICFITCTRVCCALNAADAAPSCHRSQAGVFVLFVSQLQPCLQECEVDQARGIDGTGQGLDAPIAGRAGGKDFGAHSLSAE